jgi:hypothetical protein
VSCIPVVTLGFGAALTHLLRDAPAGALLPFPGALPDDPGTVVEMTPAADPGATPEAALEVTPHPALEAARVIPADPQERSLMPSGKQPGPATPERVAAFYAADLAEGRVPSKRQIKREWPVGYDAASDLHDHLTAAMAAT